MNEVRLKFVVTAINSHWEHIYQDKPLTVGQIIKMSSVELNELLNMIWKTSDIPTPLEYIAPEKDRRSFRTVCADEIGAVLKAKKAKFAPGDGLRLINTWQG